MGNFNSRSLIYYFVILVICVIVVFGSNSKTFKELNLTLYQLPRRKASKTAGKPKLRQEKLTVDENVRECFRMRYPFCREIL